MNPTILLIGRNGQIGGDLCRFLPRLGNVVVMGRQSLDLSKPEQIRRIIADIRPQCIVNAAAYTAVDQAETDPVAARAINADAPATMAEESGKLGALLVQYSTDYVFDGQKKSPYLETDATNPLGVYGKTKSDGEEAIRASRTAHLILRTSWVYAMRGRNFLLTILRLASQREELRIVRDQTGAPTWSREIADATARVLEQLMHPQDGRSMADVRATYHMTAAGETSWFDFANAILEESSSLPEADAWLSAVTSGQPRKALRIAPISTAEFPTPARRPAYSVLSNSHFSTAFGFSLPGWRDQLRSAFSHRND